MGKVALCSSDCRLAKAQLSRKFEESAGFLRIFLRILDSTICECTDEACRVTDLRRLQHTAVDGEHRKNRNCVILFLIGSWEGVQLYTKHHADMTDWLTVRNSYYGRSHCDPVPDAPPVAHA